MARPLLPLLLALGALLTAPGCGGDEPPPPDPLRPVRWISATPSTGVRLRAFSGTATAETETELSFKVNGTIQDLPVNTGQELRRGELVARLDPKDYELQVDEANAGLQDAEAALRRDEADYARYRELYEAENASLAELETRRARAESSRAAVEAAGKRLEIAQLQLSYTELVAPMDGAVAEKLVDVNQNVGMGTGIVRLNAGERIEVDVVVPEVLIGQVQLDSRCQVTFDALPGRTYEAYVSEIGVASTSLETTFPVTARLREAAEEVKVGMAARVVLELGDGSQEVRFRLPAVAVGEDREGRYVFVVQEQGAGTGLVVRRGVTVGEMTAGGELEVFEGVEAGERVVVRGVSKIRHGQQVALPGDGADG